MRVGISFVDNIPKMFIGDLKGNILVLWGRTEYIVSKDPMIDTLSTWFNFFIIQEGDSWKFDYKTNCKYSRDEDMAIIRCLLSNANQAIEEKKDIDLSSDFNALNNVESYNFGGLFNQMNKQYEPIFVKNSPNQALAEICEKLKSSLTIDEIESDEHLKSFVFQRPLETIWVNDSVGSERENRA